MKLIVPLFPLSHGVARVDDQRVISGIIFVLHSGTRWRDLPTAYGPQTTVYNRFVRWSELGVFNRIFATLRNEELASSFVKVEYQHLRANRTAAKFVKRGLYPDMREVVP